MNEMQIFENPEFGEVRTVEIDGDAWFVGKDVAEILGYSNASKAVITHVDDEDKRFVMLDVVDSQNGNVPIGQSKTAIINESGLYSLVLSSKMPKAREFKKWVTSKVLPSIRKHGMYATDELLDNPEFAIKVFERLKEERETRKLLEIQNQELMLENKLQGQVINEMKPKADYYDTILACPDTMTVTQIAKDYGMSAHELNEKLHDYKVQFLQSGQWLLYSTYAHNGYTQSHTYYYGNKPGKRNFRLSTKWTQKGRLFIYDLLKNHGILPLIEQ